MVTVYRLRSCSCKVDRWCIKSELYKYFLIYPSLRTVSNGYVSVNI